VSKILSSSAGHGGLRLKRIGGRKANFLEKAMAWRKRVVLASSAILLGVVVSGAQQSGNSDDAGRVTALEIAWNHALEAKDTQALEMLFADSLVAVDADGSISTKSEYLASIRAADFQPSQAVNEMTKVHMYGDTAIAEGIFRIKGTEKGKPYLHRQRTIDTWVKMNGSWKCVAAVAVEIPGKKEN